MIINIYFYFLFNLYSLEYQNEARNNTPDKEEGSDKGDNKTIVFSTHASHYITLDDITFYSEEFRIGSGRNSSNRKKRKEEKTPQSRRSSSRSNESNDEEDDDENENEEGDVVEESVHDPFVSAISSFSPDNEMFYTQSSSLIESQMKENESEGGDSDDEEEETIYRNEMVLMGSINNRQEIRINMKLNEHIDGPKVSLEVMLSTILLFFTPRQFHMLLLLCDILLNGEAVNSNNADNGDNKQKEEKKTQPKYSGGLMSKQTWSAGVDDDYDCQSEVASRYGATFRPVGSDSILSSNSSMSSSMQSSASQYTSHSQRHKRAIERDHNAEISHFNVRVAGLYVLLLHDDVLITSSDDDLPLNESTVEKLRYKCDHFFNYSYNFLNTCSSSDVMKIGAILNNACDNNHLRYGFKNIAFKKKS